MKLFCSDFLKIYYKTRNCSIKYFYLAFVWICFSCQGDEARPHTAPFESVVTSDCHVTLKKTDPIRVTSTCRCNCSIWCKDTSSCKKLNTDSEEIFLVNTSVNIHSSCCETKSVPSDSVNVKLVDLSLRCNVHENIQYSSPCLVDRGTEATSSSYLILCGDHHYFRECSTVHWRPQNAVYLVIDPPNIEVVKKNTSIVKLKNLFRTRLKRSQSSISQYRIQTQSRTNSTIAVLQPFDINISIKDDANVYVEDLSGEVTLGIDGSADGSDVLNGSLRATVEKGRASFTNLHFITSGKSYKLSISYSDPSSRVQPWTSEVITVTDRQLILKPSGRALPISPRENDTLSPAAGIIIYDVVNDAPATKKYLSQYTWEGTIGLLYEDIYPGTIVGTTFQLVEDGSNEILFSDIIVSHWGYSYILRIRVKARETEYWDLSCHIGPFDIDMLDTFELPLVESSEFRRVQIVFDGEFKRVQQNMQKFEIFFLNHFGQKYPKVKWKNITVSEGSVIVDAVITGLTQDLEKTSETLSNDISSGQADIEYEGGNTWKASRSFVPSRKLLEENGNSDSQTAEEGGGLSVAWIVAIVINVILIVIFIIAIIYCWQRRKKQQGESHSMTELKHFDSHPDHALFVNKAENHKKMQQKMDARVFTVEDERRRLHSQEHGDDDRCTCYSPRCYCSVGDGPMTPTPTPVKDDNEDDPPGYPTPSPEPVFPTPIPTPIPEPEEPEDYWRPDSYPQEEPEDIYLPGAIPEPEPEPPKEDRYYFYQVTDIDGSKEMFGSLTLQNDSFLNDVRRAVGRDHNLSEAIRDREFKFLDENLDVIPTYQEVSHMLDKVFPSQEIYIQYQIPPESPELKMPRIPAYVGPLGICNAHDCTKGAKLKCLDCKNVGYCSKHCMQKDVKDHRRACYKPAWRL